MSNYLLPIPVSQGRQNLYAKKVQGLNRAIRVQRLIRALG